MPIRADYNEQSGIWEIFSEGPVEVDAVIIELRGVYERLDPTKPLLLLWTTGDGAGLLESSELRRLVEFVRENRPEVGGRTAIVAFDDATYGMGRVAQIYAEPVVPHLCVFRNGDDAMKWLREGR
jgi:hypothetical protein